MALNTVRVPRLNNNFIAFSFFAGFAIWLSVLALSRLPLANALEIAPQSPHLGGPGSAAGGGAALWQEPTETPTDPSETPTPSDTPTASLRLPLANALEIAAQSPWTAASR